MKYLTGLVFLTLCITIFGQFSKSMMSIFGIPNYLSTLRDLLLIILAFVGLLRANPLASPRLIWGVTTLVVCVITYIGIAFNEQQYGAGLYFARMYMLPIFFMMALAGALHETDQVERRRLLFATFVLTALTVACSLGLYGVMLADRGFASKLIVGIDDNALPVTWYIAGGTWMRMGLPASNPNSLGLILALMLSLLFTQFGRPEAPLRRYLPVIVSLSLLALILTFSRSSLLLFAVTALSMLAFKELNISTKLVWGTSTLGLITLSTGLVAISLIDPDSGDQILHWLELNISGNDPSMQGHITTFQEAWDSIESFYLHGFPKGSVGQKAAFFTNNINHVENSALGIFYDMGIFLGFIFMLGWFLTLSHFHTNHIQSSILIGFAVCAQFLPYFFEPDALIIFVFVYGLAGLIESRKT